MIFIFDVSLNKDLQSFQYRVVLKFWSTSSSVDVERNVDQNCNQEMMRRFSVRIAKFVGGGQSFAFPPYDPLSARSQGRVSRKPLSNHLTIQEDPKRMVLFGCSNLASFLATFLHADWQSKSASIFTLAKIAAIELLKKRLIVSSLCLIPHGYFCGNTR